MSSLLPLDLYGYAVDCFQHNHSTWMAMALNVIGITIELRFYAVEDVRHKHSTYMFMPLNMFGTHNNDKLPWLKSISLSL
jgi:hypothetical protein